jgi:hypothetical protein
VRRIGDIEVQREGRRASGPLDPTDPPATLRGGAEDAARLRAQDDAVVALDDHHVAHVADRAR